MSAFFELRIYQVLPGKMQEWLSFMEDTIIPYQVKNGMVIHGSFVMDSSDEFSIQNGERIMNSETKGNTYVWIRRFENKEHKEKLYKAVYESADWMNDIGPKVAKLIDRNSIAVHNLTSTELSIMK
jgi:hypothetical protein